MTPTTVLSTPRLIWAVNPLDSIRSRMASKSSLEVSLPITTIILELTFGAWIYSYPVHLLLRGTKTGPRRNTPPLQKAVVAKTTGLFHYHPRRLKGQTTA